MKKSRLYGKAAEREDRRRAEASGRVIPVTCYLDGGGSYAPACYNHCRGTPAAARLEIARLKRLLEECQEAAR